MSDMPTIVTHHSANCPSTPWLAHLIIEGKLFGVRFSGSTEAEAISNAEIWYKNEINHQKRVVGQVDLEPDETTPKGAKSSVWGSPSKPASNGWGNPVASSSSEHGMAGKVWLMHHGLKQRLRVNPGEVDGYLSQGWIQAGPKTPFKV